MGNVIELVDVAKRYDDVDAPALGPVNLTVAEGEALAITGPSGSGKSTLLNLVSGLDRPSSGTVAVGGGRIDNLGETALARFRRDRIGMVFQFFHLLDDLTVLDNVLLPAQLAGAPRRTSAQRAQELLEALGIARHSGAHPGRLSGGERQRVAVARALINKPALLLADEPTGALDTASGLEVRELLLDLHRSGQSLVLVTHDLALAESCGSRIVRLVDGTVAEDRVNIPGPQQPASVNRTATEVPR